METQTRLQEREQRLKQLETFQVILFHTYRKFRAILILSFPNVFYVLFFAQTSQRGGSMQFSQRHLELEEDLGTAQRALAELNEKHSQLLKRLEERERKITELIAERPQQVLSC